MILALDGTAITVSTISTLGVIGVGVIGYLGVKAQLTKTTDMNTAHHWNVSGAVRSMQSTLKDVDATIGLLVSTQGYPMFKNTPEGALIWANSAAFELLGLPFDELSNPFRWTAIIHPEDRDRVKENWDHQIETGIPAPSIVYRYVHPLTGVITKVRGRSRPIVDDFGDIQEWVSMVIPVDNQDEEEQNA